ncbi:MAG: hypothetical protein AB1768_18665 [Pseudomonadota bacterium]|jgi:hypothetical protein
MLFIISHDIEHGIHQSHHAIVIRLAVDGAQVRHRVERLPRRLNAGISN